MSDKPDQPTFDRPFPALTPAQRYHFDIFGYTIVRNTLSPDEAAACKEALYRLRDEILPLADRGPEGPRVRGAYLAKDLPHHRFMVNIIESEPEITAYATHPRLVAMAEEVIGGEARIVEINAHINARDPETDTEEDPTYGFHRGTDIPFGCHEHGGLFHCAFVKTLTNLTDLGPEDGGTVVIAGSHKIDLPQKQIIAAAYEDGSLIHQVVAPPGSTLLFAETLIHGTGRIRSDRERVILICGYGSTLYPYWDGGKLRDRFVESIPAHLRTLFKGKQHWTRGPRYRKLSEPADDRPFRLGTWDDRELMPPRTPDDVL